MCECIYIIDIDIYLNVKCAHVWWIKRINFSLTVLARAMDQYNILGRIGEGAHGIVFKAKHIEVNTIPPWHVMQYFLLLSLLGNVFVASSLCSSRFATLNSRAYMRVPWSLVHLLWCYVRCVITCLTPVHSLEHTTNERRDAMIIEVFLLLFSTVSSGLPDLQQKHPFHETS